MIAVGTILHETYRVEEQIGRGAMGVVYRVSHLRVPRAFAVKVLQPSVRDVDTSFMRFRREAEISSRLGHPNIVDVLDFNSTADGQAYFVMELLEGHDLATELQQQPTPSPARALQLLTPVASALMAAHAAGVIHRDLKPSNIFLSRKGALEVVKVLDFGVSKILGAHDLTTQSESLLGTPAYMSPEQADGNSKHVDARSDQFSLASIAYELLSGQRPFGLRGESPYLTLYKIVNQEPLPLSNLPPAIGAVVARALAKAPELRFADVASFMSALELAIGGVEVPWVAPPADAAAVAPATGGASELVTRTLTESAPLPVAPPPSSPPVAPRRRWQIGGLTALVAAGALLAIAKLHRPDTSRAPVAPPAATTVAPAAPAAKPAPAKALAPTVLTLEIVPANARVRMVDFAGATHTLVGPWSAASAKPGPARTLRWNAGERPRLLRVEADGYEPSDVSLPPEGSAVTVRVTLERKRPAASAPRHPELSYPWRSR